MVISPLQRARQNLAANVVLLQGHSVVAHVTALGQLRGNSDHANPVRSEHVVRRQAQRGDHSQATPPRFPASARGGEL